MAMSDEFKAISASAKKARTDGMAASLAKVAENTEPSETTGSEEA